MWTVGEYCKSNVYDSEDCFVCSLKTSAIAAKIVAAVNSAVLDRAEILRVLGPFAKHWAMAGYPDSALRDRYTECWSTMSAADIRAAADLHAKLSGEPKEPK